MRRYSFLSNNDVYEALNHLRDAFLAAKDGKEVNEIIKGILTEDEQLRIGRRIMIAEALKYDWTYKELCQISNVGRATIIWVSKQVTNYPLCFELLFKRQKKLEKEYRKKKYRKVGGSLLVFKKKEYTGLKRSEIKR